MAELENSSPTLTESNEPLSQEGLELIKIQKETIQGYINICADTYKSSNQEFDKQLVYIAGGGLALTIGFVKDIVSITTATHTWLLLSTWISFVVAIFFNFLSHKVAAEAADDSLVYWNHQKAILDRLEEPNAKKESKISSSTFKNQFVIWFNSICIIAATLGIVFFVSFTFTNLDNDRRSIKTRELPARPNKRSDSTSGSANTPTKNSAGSSTSSSNKSPKH
jgi:hypothetical protein